MNQNIKLLKEWLSLPGSIFSLLAGGLLVSRLVHKLFCHLRKTLQNSFKIRDAKYSLPESCIYMF